MFTGTARYEVVRPIGRGGMGAVYEAVDHMRKARVALKLLENLAPEALTRFKREFRALADIHHPNLVTLHELVGSEGHWFFTMELIDGCGLLEYLHGKGPTSGRAETEPPSGPLTDPDALQRLRAKTRQLVEGTAALHAAGMVHRDLKPSNVMVDRGGRVVVLDFGLVADTAARDRDTPQQIVGTPDYLSPEQVRGLPVTPASDWYSLGIILYEALTGDVPFAGPALQVMTARLEVDPQPPRALVPEVPEDLDALCRDLLRRDPAQRPDAAAILARLGAPPAGPAAVAASVGAPFVGRASQLEALGGAFARARAGSAAVVLVSGPSGMGKSTLLRRFVDQVAAGEPAIVLEGRCYERESVPYQAFDALIDALARVLAALTPEELAAVAPTDAGALARVFPVLRNLLPLRFGGGATSDPLELRRRALADLRTLVQRLSARAPLLLVIDDLQWGDQDSAAVIGELIREPQPPRLALVLAFRSEHLGTSPLLRHLHGRGRGLLGRAVSEVAVGALAPAEAQALARTLLGDGGDGAHSEERARAIAWEAGGHPMFLHELARYQATSGAGQGGEPVTLAGLLRLRLERLPAPSRALLDVIAVAGRPLALLDAETAAGLAGDDGRALTVLRAQHLVRTHGTRRYDLVEPYHDQIRETALESIDAERSRAIHGRLARALEASESRDAEMLAAMWQGAGEPVRAALHARRAAEQAAEALAFGHAAELYEEALRLDPQLAGRHEVEVLLAGALANAGRGRDSARVYLEAIAGARSRAETVELTRLAADQLLRTGEVHEGMERFADVFGALGLPFARSPRGALLSAMMLRARTRLRGLGFRRRPPAEVPVEALLRIDTCWTAAAGMGFVDTIRGAELQTRGLLLALRAGEPYRISRALSAEAAFRSSAGGEDDRGVVALIARAEALAREVDSPHALALCGLASTVSAYLRGRWRLAADLALETIDLLRDHCTGVHWELASMRLLHLWSLAYLGRWRDLPQLMAVAIREADDLGDMYSTTNLRGGLLNLAWLMPDDPVEAQAQAEQALERWPGRGFQLQHYNAIQSLTNIDLYCGRPEAAERRIAAATGPLRRSMLLSVQQIRLEMLQLHGLIALAGSGGPAEARHWARKMERERMRWSGSLSFMLRAGAAAREGNREEAVRHLRAAIAVSERADMLTQATLSRIRLGELLGGDEGAALVTAGRTALQEQGVADPRRWATMWAPGYPD